MRASKPTAKNRNFSSRAEHSELSESHNFWEFSQKLVRNTRLFGIWARYVKYFRRFRIITTAFRVTPWILLAISTNTLLYVVAAVVVFLVPILLLGLLSLVGSALLRYRGINERMADKLRGKTVYVLFPLRNGEFASGSFWRANARDLAARDASSVIVVSPYLISPHGLEDGNFYFNVRTEGENIFLVRRHYFFSLRKNVLTQCVGRLILIY